MPSAEIKEKVLRYESFINDVLKEDLKEILGQLDARNTEIAEWVQLKTVLTCLKESEMTDGFKTKMDIGTNVYVQVNVPDASKILINIGSGIFVEYTIEEALKFIEKKINLLNKQTEILKTNSSKIKARIKLVLHGIQELSNIK